MIRIKKPSQIYILFISILLNATFYYIVYITGGTAYPYPHLFYFVIIIAALFGNWLNVIFTSFLSSILMSYWFMPLEVSEKILQDHFSWIFRSFMFIFIAVIVKISTDIIRKRKEALIKKSQQLMDFQRAAFNSILELAETNEPETTGKHLERLAAFAEVLMKDMDVPQKEKEYICTFIAFHDIGKVGIPDSILLKPGKLTEYEYEKIKEHTIIGGEILTNLEKSIDKEEEELHRMIKIAKELTYFHHERPDGKGYPFGLKGDEIPLAARITALCDVYDALSTKRPYKEALPHEECVKIIKKGRGTQFDAEIVDYFLNVEQEFKEIAERLKDKKVIFLENVKRIKGNKDKIALANKIYK